MRNHAEWTRDNCTISVMQFMVVEIYRNSQACQGAVNSLLTADTCVSLMSKVIAATASHKINVLRHLNSGQVWELRVILDECVERLVHLMLQAEAAAHLLRIECR
jgi:hypothetical protein